MKRSIWYNALAWTLVTPQKSASQTCRSAPGIYVAAAPMIPWLTVKGKAKDAASTFSNWSPVHRFGCGSSGHRATTAGRQEQASQPSGHNPGYAQRQEHHHRLQPAFSQRTKGWAG